MRSRPLFVALILLAPGARVAAAIPAKAPPVEIVWNADIPNSYDLKQDLLKRYAGHSYQVDGVAFSPDGSKVLSASRDNTIKLWDAVDLHLLGTWLGHENSVGPIAFSPDGAKALSGSSDDTVRLWDAKTGLVLDAFSSGVHWPRTVAFSPEGTRAAAGYWNGEIRVWDVALRRPLYVSVADQNIVNYAAFTRDGKRILTIGDDSLRLIDAGSGRTLSSAPFESGAGRLGALSADGSKLLVWTVSPSPKLILWDMSAWRPLGSWPTKPLNALAYSPDGAKALLGEAGGDIVVWDIAEGRPAAVWPGNGTAVNSLAFSPDGTKAASGGDDHALRLWDVATGRLLATGFGQAANDPHCSNKRSDKKGMTAVAEMADDIVACALAGFAGPPPQATTLEQGKYESRAQFDARASAAKELYDARSREFAAKSALLPSEIRALAVRSAVGSELGSPKVASTRYDPETGTFTARILGYSGSDVELTLDERVPAVQAPAFDKALAEAKPRVIYVLDGDRLSFARAELRVSGKTYAAFPAKSAPPPAQVKVGAAPAALKTAAPLHYAENPALAAKERELAALRRKRAEQSQLRALEAEIAQLKGEADSAPKTAPKASDVDEPRYKRTARPDDFALVIGIEKYKSLPPADFAGRDAEAVRRHFLALGLPERNIVMLTGDLATKSRIQAYLEEWLPKNVKPASTVFLYYSGHGAPDAATSQAYLIPADGDPTFLKTTAYPLASLYGALNKLPAKRVIVALDACFSGAGGRSVMAKGARPLVAKVEESQGVGRVVLLAASAGDQITGGLDDQGHGLFTYFLLKGLAQQAKVPTAEVTAGTLFKFLSPRVQDEAHRANREQTPVLVGDGPFAAR